MPIHHHNQFTNSFWANLFDLIYKTDQSIPPRPTMTDMYCILMCWIILDLTALLVDKWRRTIHRFVLCKSFQTNSLFTKSATDLREAVSLKPATHAPETGTSRLVPETCTCVGQSMVPVFSGTSFWYGIEHSSIPSQKLCGTWHQPCNVIGRPVVIVFVVISYRLFS